MMGTWNQDPVLLVLLFTTFHPFFFIVVNPVFLSFETFFVKGGKQRLG
jgi:hypothetical protein